MNKVDRALELQVIDWLQWYDFPHDPKNPNIVELALELIQKRKQENEKLRAENTILINALILAETYMYNACQPNQKELLAEFDDMNRTITKKIRELSLKVDKNE